MISTPAEFWYNDCKYIDPQTFYLHTASTQQRMGCRSSWSALYDDSSEEKEARGLQAEASQASSLSFQPHNLFKEHFSAGTSPTGFAAAKDTLSPSSSVRPATQKSETRAAHTFVNAPAEASVVAATENQPEGAYTPRTRKLWEQQAEVEPKARHASAASPRSIKHGPDQSPGSKQMLGQSPAGKPPLPRLPGKGSLQPATGFRQSPRHASGSSRIPSASIVRYTDSARSASASPPPMAKSRAAAGFQAEKRSGSEPPEATLTTPMVRNNH